MAQSEKRYIGISYYMLNHQAFQDLSPKAVRVLVELKKRFNGSNNGKISLSHREIGEICHMSKSGAKKILDELYRHGFINPAKRGVYTLRRASEWILTFERTNESKTPKTDDWRNYDSKQKKVPERGQTVPVVEL